jgi:hypothetical protein
MTTNETYERIVSTAPEDLGKWLVQVLGNYHRGEDRRITRKELVISLRLKLMESLVKYPSASTLDRQIRNAIMLLQEQGYPICSDSGQGGYWWATTYNEREAYIAEIESRANKLILKARKLRSAPNVIWNPPQEVSQPNLF